MEKGIVSPAVILSPPAWRSSFEKALPFEMRVPNTLKATTLEKSERGEDVHHTRDTDDLFSQLGI